MPLSIHEPSTRNRSRTEALRPNQMAGKFLAGIVALGLLGCHSKEERALRELQEQGIPVTGQSLINAIGQNDRSLAEMLLTVDVPLDSVNSAGLSPLIQVVSSRDKVLLDAILAKAKPELLEKPDGDGFTALSHAMVLGDHAMVERLLEAGANPNVNASPGETAIAFAVRSADSELVSGLLTRSKHPLPPEVLGEPLFQSVKAGHHEIASMLMEAGVAPNYFSTIENKSPLAASIEANDTEMAKELVAKGAAMLTVLPVGSAATGSSEGEKFLEPHLMTVAFDHENMELVHLLLELNAPLDGEDANGMTPLKRALASGNLDLVRLLLEHGAKPDDTLIMALESPDAKVIDMLLAHGASLEATNEAGDTPMHIALERNDLQLAAQLMESEPNLNAPGRFGQNVLCVAVAKQNLPFLELLLKRGADPNTTFNPGLNEGFKEIVGNKKFQFYLRKDVGLTPIMLSAAYGNIEMAKLLIDHGASRFKTSRNYHRWPVNFACEEEHIACAQLLLGRDPQSNRDVRIEISLSDQRAVLYKGDKAVLSTEVSTGKRGYSTPTGNFLITNKKRRHSSTLYGSEMPYFQRLSCADFGFHVGSCPGYPASHGCIRMPHDKAKAFFSTTQVGDPVTIVP